MAAPVPHFMAGVTSPAIHQPVLAGFAPVVASSPLTAAPVMASPLVHTPMTLPAPVMPQLVPIAAGGQPLSKLKNV